MSETTTLAPSDEYFAQMASSLGDKSRLASHLVPGTVADIGAGGGELANYLGISASTWIDHVYAADVSPEALARIRALKSDPHQMRQIRPELDPADIPHNERLTVVEGSFTAAFEAAEGQVDNIVLSSVLHEVYSYAPGLKTADINRTGGDEVGRRLRQSVEALRPGGRLLIRDGIRPDRPDRMVRVYLDSIEVIEAVRTYRRLIEDSKHLSLRNHRPLEAGMISGPNYVVLPAHAAAEMLLTLTWGTRHLSREIHEHYTWAGRDTYPWLVEEQDDSMQLVHFEQYTQPGYREAMRHWTITDAETGRPWFPRTNAVWVFEWGM